METNKCNDLDLAISLCHIPATGLNPTAFIDREGVVIWHWWPDASGWAMVSIWALVVNPPVLHVTYSIYAYTSK